MTRLLDTWQHYITSSRSILIKYTLFLKQVWLTCPRENDPFGFNTSNQTIKTSKEKAVCLLRKKKSSNFCKVGTVTSVQHIQQPSPSGSQQVRANSLNAGIHFRPQGRSRSRCRCLRAGEKRISLRIKERSVLVNSKEKLGIRSKQRGKKRHENSQTSAQTGDPMRVHMHTPRTQPAVQTWICSFYFPHFLRIKKRKKLGLL